MFNKVTFTIYRITVLNFHNIPGGEDEITFYLDAPTTYPELEYEPPIMKLKCRKGYAKQWMFENYPNIPYDLIQI